MGLFSAKTSNFRNNSADLHIRPAPQKTAARCTVAIDGAAADCV